MKTCFQDLRYLFESLLIASLVVSVCHAIFYFYSPLIWSFNSSIPLDDYSPWGREFVNPHDGIEIYIIYLATFICIATALTLSKSTRRIKNIIPFLILSLLMSSIYFYKFIGLRPPMSLGYPNNIIGTLIVFSCLVLTAFFLIRLQETAPRMLWIIVAIMLFPLCFVSTEPLLWEDASYIFNPALKILHGTNLSNIYFQYDFLLSFLATIWLKLNIAPQLFRLFGQSSLYVLIISMVFFSQAFFKDKKFSIYLLISLVICKIYANLADSTSYLQVTPLRLDLWVILICLFYNKGPYHKSLPLTLGALILFHHSFGMIYFLCYCQLICILAFLDIGLFTEQQQDRNFAIRAWAKKYFSLNVNNIFILFGALLLYLIIFRDFNRLNEGLYLKFKLGFLPIIKTSFYWCILTLLCVFSIFISKCRKFINERHFHTCIFLLLLSIGQSVYFFGRSHENNIINLAAIYLLCFFTFLDLIGRYFQKNEPMRKGVLTKLLPSFVSISFIFGTAYCYHDQIINKFRIQYDNLVYSRVLDGVNPIAPDLKLIKQVTHDSSKVYFMIAEDFLYYHYGKYFPSGYFSPYHSLIIKKDAVAFLSELLKNDYFLVAKAADKTSHEMIRELKFANVYKTGDYYFISNVDSDTKQELIKK